MTVRPERHAGPRPGLAALIPQRTAGQPGPVEIPLDRIRTNPDQPRQHFDDASLATLDGEHPRARRHPADPRDRDDRRLPARRRRAPRSAPRRPPASTGSRPSSASSPNRRSSSSRSSRTSSARTSTRSRPPAAYRQLIDEFGFTPGAHRRAASAEPDRPSPTRSGCSISRRASRRPSPRAGSPRAMPGRWAASAPTHQDRVLDDRRGAGPLGPPDRGARPPPARAAAGPPRRAQRPPHRIPSSNGSRRTCARPSAPRSASPGRGVAAGSSSSTTATKNWGGSTSA